MRPGSSSVAISRASRNPSDAQLSSVALVAGVSFSQAAVETGVPSGPRQEKTV